ncbi:TPA: esterase, partial [Salmonella enterica]|nr:esterase [Salmonella enterica]
MNTHKLCPSLRFASGQKIVLLAAILLMAAGVLTLCFPESWYP